MRSFLLLLLIVSFPIYAHTAHVKCYQDGIQIYNKTVKTVYYGDGFVIAANNKKADILFGDCIIHYETLNPLK
jgi:hypothetical protein